MASPEGVARALRRVNERVALAIGLALLAAAAFTLIDVAGRSVGAGLGGGEEIAGYAMAAATSWSLGCGLSAMAHVRIDIVRIRLRSPARALFDLLALVCVSGVATLIALRCWPVLARSLENGSRANTALETPLWLPQALWFSGWLWFATCAALLTLCALWALARRDPAAVAAMAGVDEGASA